MRQGIVWQFKTAHLTISLEIERDRRYQYDGDDEDGETQARLDSGEYVAFNSRVIVQTEDGEEIGADFLGSSVYSADNVESFWTEHRTSDAMNRNCSIMRSARGTNVSICHYFPGMVLEACRAARSMLPINRRNA